MALLIILQSLLAPYQLLLLKKSTLEQICTHIPYFYFAFSVLLSSPVEEVIKVRF